MAEGEEECGYDTEFVKAPDFQSECSICLLILREPQQVKCCGERFCKKCVKNLVYRRQVCPKCRKLLQYFPDKKCQQELNKLKIRCSNRKHGCSWTGGLCDLNKHLNSKPTPTQVYLGCEVVSLKCTYCRKNFKRVELKDHTEKRCDCRPYSCEYCEQYRSTYRTVQSHYSACLYFTVTCSKCTAKLRRKDQQDHLDNTCPLVEVECEYNYAGCDARVLRKDLCAHMRDVDHSTLLIKYLQENIVSLQSESCEAQKMCESLSSMLKDTKAERDDAKKRCAELSNAVLSGEFINHLLLESLSEAQTDRDTAKKMCETLSESLSESDRRLRNTQYGRRQRDRLNTIKNNDAQRYKKQVQELEKSNSRLKGFLGGVIILFIVCFIFVPELWRFKFEK